MAHTVRIFNTRWSIGAVHILNHLQTEETLSYAQVLMQAIKCRDEDSNVDNRDEVLHSFKDLMFR